MRFATISHVPEKYTDLRKLSRVIEIIIEAKSHRIKYHCRSFPEIVIAGSYTKSGMS